MFVFKEEKTSFAVGHMALAYLLGKASAKLFKVNLNIPLILVLSIIPDIDILFDFLLKADIHRGPTHSIIVAIVVFIPFFVLYRKKAVPYFAALASHSLIGDFLIGGQLQLLWPLSTNEFGLHELGFPYINIYDPINIALEFTLFAIALVVMLKTRDLFHFFRNNKLNLILIIPIFTVLLPTFAGYPLSVPILLVLPHLFYLVIFSIAVLLVFFRRRT
jgi:membrane-bound metal-dependent hydrolase YbcI (DUF457 family)